MSPQEVESELQSVLTDHQALSDAVRAAEPASDRLLRVVDDATCLRLVATTERLLRRYLEEAGHTLGNDGNLSTLSERAIRVRRERLGVRRPTSGDRTRREAIEPYRIWRNGYGHGASPPFTEEVNKVKRDLARFLKGLL